MTSVELKNVTKLFGDVTAVNDISLTIEPGELFFLLGASGCGKTTALRMIAGFYQPDQGEILFNSERIDHLPPQKRNTGMVFQNYALWPHLKVYQNVEYGLNVRKVPKTEKHKRVMRALATVRMEDLAERYPNELSGGQQQRVALARALVIEPGVLLFDEPLSNLDAKLRLEMRAEIKRIHAETAITTVYVTHDQKEALSLADRMAIMNNGRIEQTGSAKEIYHLPRNRFVAGFIGEANIIRATAGRQVPEHGLQLDTPFGTLFSTINTENVEPGTAVDVMVRPEGIAFGKESINTFEARMEDVTYLGDMEQCLLDIKGQPVKAFRQETFRETLGRGDTVKVSFGSDQVVVLQ